MLLKEVFWKINTSIWICRIKKKNSLMEAERKDKPHQSPQKAHPNGEFVVVVEYCTHIILALTSSFANVVRQ